MTIRRIALMLLASALLLVACDDDLVRRTDGGSGATSPTATLMSTASSEREGTATTTSTPPVSMDTAAAGLGTPEAPVAPEAPSVEAAMQHIESLAVEIGSRPAGSPEEREAADYLAGELRSYGYDVTLEEFSFTSRFDDSRIELPDGKAMHPYGLGGSGFGEARGPLVYAGLGSGQELAEAGVQGAIVVVDRGELTFEQKARNAQEAGASALIIVNSEPGPLFGSLGSFQAAIPIVGAIPEDGEILRNLAERGAEVTIRAGIGSDQGESQNVVGRTGEECRWYIGGHYDSVPAGPGANDNASGTAVVLELARTHRTEGLCVIAFGAEEVGLFGSRAYVRDHNTSSAEWMLNFDMQGRIDGAKVIGDALLTEEVLIALEGGDFPLVAGSFPRFASSDHVSFEDAGVPAVTVTSGDDPFIHSSRDDIENVRPGDLETMLTAGSAMLEALLAAGDGAP